MAEDKLEEILKNSSPEKESGKKEEKKKPVGVLESVVNETFDAASKLGRGAASVALPVLADSSMGGFGASSTAAAFYAAESIHSSCQL
ncbi:hypothetical protein HYX08_05065 [Candidatus Woesearchaeota archaeon]|nr:hypothetical protein [Candidatus Woesearchaeota archaeon]